MRAPSAAMATLHRIVVVAVGLVLMVVLQLAAAICVLSRARRPSRRVAEHAGEESGGGGGGGLSAEEVAGLPCQEFKEGGAGGECAVCLDAFRSGDRCRALPRCGHGFHAECLDSWLRKSRRCPVCRTEAVEQQKEKDGPGAVAATATVEIVSQV